MDNSLENKLIILYFLSGINSSINMSEITTFLVENNYADYISANNYLAELSDSGLINAYQKDNKVIYKINEQGKNTLDMFDDKLTDNTKDTINNYLIDFKDLSTNSLHTSFNYEKDANEDYNIHCSIIKDKDMLFEINIPGIKENDLKRIENNWDSNKLTIMKNIKENLM